MTCYNEMCIYNDREKHVCCVYKLAEMAGIVCDYKIEKKGNKE